MKKHVKSFAIALIAALSLVTLALACACGSSKKATLRLDAGEGGTLTQTEYSLKAGADLNKFLEGKEPRPLEGLTFAGWFNDGAKLAPDATMPEAGISLQAKYDVSYTVNLYISDNYGVYGAPQTTTGTARYHEPFTAQVQDPPEHFELDPDKTSVRSTPSLEPGDVFDIWYRREPIVVSYRVNAPDGVEIGGTVLSVPLEFNSTLTVSDCLFTAPRNYRFTGWATSSDGTGERYFGGDAIQNVTESFALFATWERGYTDLFGGDDIIFLPDGREGEALLVRGGVEFEGTLSADGGFSFGTGEGRLEGKLGDGYTFSYFRAEQAGKYLRYDAHLGASAEADPNAFLTLDGLGGAQYTYRDGEGKEVVLAGSYLPLGGTDLSLELENGQTYAFALGTVDGAGVFSFYDGAEGSYGEGLASGVAGVIPGENYLTLDGLGLATLVDYSAHEIRYGLYTVESGSLDGTMFLIRAEIEGAGETHFFILAADGLDLYLVRSDEAGRYEAADGSGATLELDGFGVFGESALLTADGHTSTGPYKLRRSERFGEIVDLYSEDAAGRLTLHASYLLGDGMTFELFEEDVAEYTRIMLSDAGSATPGYPMLILYGEAYGSGAPEGALKADVYDMGASDALEQAASGYYTTKDLGGGLLYYTLVVTQVQPGHTGSVWQSVQFLTGMVGLSDGGSLDVYYTFYIDGKPTFLLATEEGKAGKGGELWISSVGVAGMGGLYFAEDGTVYEGSYAPVGAGEEGVQYYTFTSYLSDETAEAGYTAKEFYFRVTQKGDAYTYARLDELPAQTASVFFYVDRYGEQAEDNGGLLSLGKDNTAMYIRGGTESDMYFGTYADTGRTTAWGNKIFTFTPGAQEGAGGIFVPDPIEPFDFICETVEGAGYGCFYIYDEALCGTLSSENGATLALDGFYYRAKYTNSYGETFDGYYILYDDHTLWFRDGETFETYRFPLTEDGFKDVDEETEMDLSLRYAIVDDSGLSIKGYDGYTFAFRADGTLTLYNASGASVTTGKWAPFGEDGVLTVEAPLLSGDTLQWRVKLDPAASRCTVFNDAAEGVYTSGDRTVLQLDGWGGGTYFDFYGTSSPVTVVRVSGEYLVVAEGGGAWEFFAAVDGEHKTFQRIENDAKYAAFYTKDLLHSVVFASKLYVDGNALGYYLVGESGATATVYVKNGNAYSAMELPLPADGDKTYLYANVTYFRFGGGKVAFGGQLTFEDRDPVSVTLTLTPAGLELFPASASVTYAEGEDSETVGGFTLAAVNGSLLFYDARGGEYGLTLAWDPDGGENSATVEGDFIYYSAIYDSDAVSSNMVYFGYYGLGELKIGKDLWYFDFEDAKDTAGDPLRFVTETAPWEMEAFGSSNAHGACYGFEMTGKDGELYFARYFLVNSNLQAWKEGAQTLPDMLIYSIDLCRTLTFADGGTAYTLEIEQCFYNNSFKETFAVGDILGAMLYVGGTPVEAEWTEGSGNTLVWRASEGTYTVTLTQEEGFAAGFSVAFAAAQ